MAPLSKAINAEYARTVKEEGRAGTVDVYRGDLDPEWSVYSIPHGGYVLSLIVEAVVRHQSGTPHPDPIHLTAHFLKPSIGGPFEVHIRTIKTGKGFKNLSATLVQRDADVVVTHVICGKLQEEPAPSTRPAAGTDISNMTIAPPSPFATRIPMYTHPAKSVPHPPLPRWTYKDRLQARRDPVYQNKMRTARGIGGVEWGEYLTLTGEDDHLTLPMLAFLADSHMPFPVLLPSEKNSVNWYPTMVLTLEFKFPLPKLGDKERSQRTVAIYSRGKFVNDPSARHDTYVEVWTAPPLDATDGLEGDSWKDQQRCLAVSTQMGLILHGGVFAKQGAKDKDAKL